MGEIDVLVAARNRLLSDRRDTVAGALTEKNDNDVIVRLLEDVYTRRGKTGDPLDAVELEIAQRIDRGTGYPIANQDAYQSVKWLAQMAVENLPEKMPRQFALYFAIAWKELGKYPTIEEGLKFVLDNFEFEMVGE